jgi:hypothetical protein
VKTGVKCAFQIQPASLHLAVAFTTLAPTSVTAALAPAGDLLGNVLLFIFFASAGVAQVEICS